LEEEEKALSSGGKQRVREKKGSSQRRNEDENDVSENDDFPFSHASELLTNVDGKTKKTTTTTMKLGIGSSDKFSPSLLVPFLLVSQASSASGLAKGEEESERERMSFALQIIVSYGEEGDADRRRHRGGGGLRAFPPLLPPYHPLIKPAGGSAGWLGYSSPAVEIAP